MFFYLLAADQNIRLYDTSRGRFSLRRTVKARDVGWSVLDVCFTPDTNHVLYSSWSDYSKANGPVNYDERVNRANKFSNSIHKSQGFEQLDRSSDPLSVLQSPSL